MVQSDKEEKILEPCWSDDCEEQAERITVEDAPGWELAHLECEDCGVYFVGSNLEEKYIEILKIAWNENRSEILKTAVWTRKDVTPELEDLNRDIESEHEIYHSGPDTVNLSDY